MSGREHNYGHAMYEYSDKFRRGDNRVSYKSDKYPWLLAAFTYHNKVNMHSDWDLIKAGVPQWVYDEGLVKGQHYIMHYSSHSPTDYIYTDAIDIHAHPHKLDESIIYGGCKDFASPVTVGGQAVLCSASGAKNTLCSDPGFAYHCPETCGRCGSSASGDGYTWLVLVSPSVDT